MNFLLYFLSLTLSTLGVLFLCGHAQNGKASGDYQTCAITLAKQGFVVLMIDPVNQGERYQFT